jgi:hypothetical protein
MPIEAFKGSAIEETCEARTQRRIFRVLTEFEVQSLGEQVYLMISIIRTNLGMQITNRQLSALFHHSGGWAQEMIG